MKELYLLALSALAFGNDGCGRGSQTTIEMVNTIERVDDTDVATAYSSLKSFKAFLVLGYGGRASFESVKRNVAGLKVTISASVLVKNEWNEKCRPTK